MRKFSTSIKLCNFQNYSIDYIKSRILEFDISLFYFIIMGKKRDYNEVWKMQKYLHELRVSNEIPNLFLLLEHNSVYTFGKNSNKNHLLDTHPKDTEVIQIDRGGDLTYHGPGQLVGYPILNLKEFTKSISWYMRSLEKMIINTLFDFNINGSRKKGLTGVWIEDEKVCAMGVRIAKWTTMHGFALNYSPEMKYFNGMIPCGILEYGVTSLSSILDKETDFDELTNRVIINFKKTFLS